MAKKLVIALAWALATSMGSAEPVVVKSVRGNAEIQKSRSTTNRWNALKKGTPIKPGDSIRTGKDSRVELKIEDGSRVVLGSKSRIQLALSAPSRVFSLAVGRVKSFVKKLQPQSKFEIRTPLAAAAVRGTVFEVGYDEEKESGYLDVQRGTVDITQGDRQLAVEAGERMDFLKDVPLGEAPSTQTAPPPTSSDMDRPTLRREVGLGMSKEMVMAAAAQEIRNAEYQEGKVLTDVNGNRVRLEEYIIRRPTDLLAVGKEDRSFKLVVLNERESRFDYFYYLGIFNKTLPDDLSTALKDVRGKLNVQPEYYLDSYEMGQSNTIDAVQDNATGGHLVKITYDGTHYTLSDPDNPSDTRTLAADTTVTVGDATYHDVYDPVADRVTRLTDAQYLAGEGQSAVYDSQTETFRPIENTDTYWRTSYNSYSHRLVGPGYDNVKQSYLPSSGFSTILSLTTDADFTYPVDPDTGNDYPYSVVETPSGADKLHNRITIFYADGSEETADTYIFSDEGHVAGAGAFAGISTGPAFKNELLKWNYQQILEATEFNGRKIDLVVEPRILIRSGLIP